ncbi:MAG: ERF family protein, partial [Bradymonadaceae bacterium]
MSLAKKIAEVMLAVKSPPQTGRNKFLGYQYSTRDDIFGVIRGELGKRGVAVLPEVLSVVREPTGRTTKSGAETMRVNVEMAVTLIDGESGEERRQLWAAEAQTEDEKGVPQAITQGLRFWAVNTFLLCDGSDEQMYGEPGTQVGAGQPVHRKEAPPTNPRQAIIDRLRGLLYNDESIAAFGGYVARFEKAAHFNDVEPGRLMVWAGKLKAMSDQDVH